MYVVLLLRRESWRTYIVDAIEYDHHELDLSHGVHEPGSSSLRTGFLPCREHRASSLSKCCLRVVSRWIPLSQTSFRLICSKPENRREDTWQQRILSILTVGCLSFLSWNLIISFSKLELDEISRRLTLSKPCCLPKWSSSSWNSDKERRRLTSLSRRKSIPSCGNIVICKLNFLRNRSSLIHSGNSRTSPYNLRLRRLTGGEQMPSKQPSLLPFLSPTDKDVKWAWPEIAEKNLSLFFRPTPDTPSLCSWVSFLSCFRIVFPWSPLMSTTPSVCIDVNFPICLDTWTPMTWLVLASWHQHNFDIVQGMKAILLDDVDASSDGAGREPARMYCSFFSFTITVAGSAVTEVCLISRVWSCLRRRKELGKRCILSHPRRERNLRWGSSFPIWSRSPSLTSDASHPPGRAPGAASAWRTWSIASTLRTLSVTVAGTGLCSQTHFCLCPSFPLWRGAALCVASSCCNYSSVQRQGYLPLTVNWCILGRNHSLGTRAFSWRNRNPLRLLVLAAGSYWPPRAWKSTPPRSPLQFFLCRLLNTPLQSTAVANASAGCCDFQGKLTDRRYMAWGNQGKSESRNATRQTYPVNYETMGNAPIYT